MNSRTGYFILVSVGFISSAAIVFAASANDTSLSVLSLLAALLFGIAIIVASVIFNIPEWFYRSYGRIKSPVEFSRVNASLMALTYGWGALTLLGVYTLSGLWWWHSWQYGGGMFAVAVALLFYVRAVGRPGHVLRERRLLDAGAVLSIAQGLGSAGGLFFLFHTHKLSSQGVDWPANHVFLAGGIALCVVSFVAAATYFIVREKTKFGAQR